MVGRHDGPSVWFVRIFDAAAQPDSDLPGAAVPDVSSDLHCTSEELGSGFRAREPRLGTGLAI